MTSAIGAPTAKPSASPNPSRGKSAPTILVIDDSSLCRELTCAALHSEGFIVKPAVDGQAAIEEMAHFIPDVILLDNEMPRMNGIEFLRTLRATENWKLIPVVMLSTSAAKTVIVEAIRLGICGYLLKERFSMPEMLLNVRNALVRGKANRAPQRETSPPPQPTAPAPAKAVSPAPVAPKTAPISVPNLSTREATLAGVSEIGEAKTMAGVITQIIAIATSPKANSTELAGVLKLDPLLAARVIQLASSPAYAASKSRVSSIDDAVRIVGVSAINDLAATVSVFTAFGGDQAAGIDLLRCWQHAFAVASIMGKIVPKTDGVPSGIGHLIGLCHDLGEILLRQKFPNEFLAAKDFAHQGGVPVFEMLPAVFGVSYSELIQSVLERIKFPAMAIEPIKQFALHMAGPLAGHSGTLPRALAIADCLANGMLLSSSTENLVAPVAQNDCRSALIPPGALNVAEIHSEAITTVGMLSELDAKDEAALSRPLFDRREVTLCYVRPIAFAPLDPLAAAIGNLARIEIRERLSKSDELAGVDGIIVASVSAGESHFIEAMRMRTQDGRDLPLLNLTAKSDVEPASSERAGVENASYPLSIRRLAQFVASLKKK
jgi:two-component system chemotaxis response regulator CheY